MPDIDQLFDRRTLDQFDEQTLEEAALVAELAHRDIIKSPQLPRLATVFGEEKAGLVSEALETLEAMTYSVDR